MSINELLKKLFWSEPRTPYTADDMHQAYYDGIAFERDRILEIIKNANSGNRFDWLMEKINGD